VKIRFISSVSANIYRAGIGFAAGIVVARSLSPIGYGDLSFLLGSFVTIRALLDMGSSNAFFTFLSQHSRGRRFHLYYFAWMALQFIITMLFVAFLIPAELFEQIWLGNSRGIVILAFFAAFMQQQVWQMINQLAEAMRKTVRIQILNSVIATAYLLVVSMVWSYGAITVELVFQLLILQYLVAAAIAYWFLKEVQEKFDGTEIPFKQMLGMFIDYCRPLIGLTIVGFLYAFSNKWMLQKFGGSAEQGFFQIASQFAQVSLLATASILNIFWKEIADAIARDDHARVARLYQKINRGLVMLSAVITGFLLPWSEQIVTILLGAAYVKAWPVLAVMLLYPIHQSMGQIGGTMFLASGNTKKYMLVGIINMIISLPFAYLLLAPTSGMLITGLGLGAIGMACHTVISNAIGVNIQAWVIARSGGWKYDWEYQLVGVLSMIGIGWFAKLIVGLYWDLNSSAVLDLVMPVTIAGFTYAILAGIIVWSFPWLIDSHKNEIKKFLKFKS
jgi:O-antigen/teichoic acid export membrane protein